MPTVKSLEDLKKIREEALEKRKLKTASGNVWITVEIGTCGIAAGARETMKAILDTIETQNLTGITVTQTGCMGLCEKEPIVQVAVGDQPKVTYGKVNPLAAKRIMQQHVVDGKTVEDLVIPL
jgi:NADP-reducing hydrogenase subunit HndB